ALRRLVTLLDASGDRAAALRALGDFTRRLAAALDLEPSEETRGLRAGIAKGSRDAGHGSRDAGHGSRVAGHGSRGAADGGRDAGPAGGAGDGVETSATTVAVLPFASRGDPAPAWLGEGIVDLLATAPGGAGGGGRGGGLGARGGGGRRGGYVGCGCCRASVCHARRSGAGGAG